MNPEEIVPEWAFAGVPRLRHVSVESGIRLIGAEAWQDCRQLRIVKLPATVVGIADNAFRDCKLLNSVLAPGCRDFGYKAFSECCSLQRVYASGGAVNVFNGETNFGQYLFQGCINLAEVTLSAFPSPRSESKGSTLQDRTRELAPGCLSSTGIYTLALPKHFVTPKMADRPYNQYGTIHCSEDRWDQLCGWLTGNPTFRLQLASHKQALRDHMGCSQETTDPSNKARRTDPPMEAGSSSTAAGSSWHSKPPPPPSPSGWSTGGGSSVVIIRSLPTQQLPPCRSTSAMRWVTLVTFSIVA